MSLISRDVGRGTLPAPEEIFNAIENFPVKEREKQQTSRAKRLMKKTF